MDPDALPHSDNSLYIFFGNEFEAFFMITPTAESKYRCVNVCHKSQQTVVS